MLGPHDWICVPCIVPHNVIWGFVIFGRSVIWGSSLLPRRHQHRHRERGGLQPPPAAHIHARVLLRGRGAGHHCGGHCGVRDGKLHPCGCLPSARSLFTYGSGPALLCCQSANDALSYGPFAQDYFGVPNVANTTGVPNGAVPTSPIAVLFVQVWQACKHPRAWLLGSLLSS